MVSLVMDIYMRLRNKLRRAFYRAWPRVTLWLSYPRPELPPAGARWQTQPYHKGEPDYGVWLLFITDHINPRNLYHVVTVIETSDVWIVINGNLSDTGILVLYPDEGIEDEFWNDESAEYVVRVPCSTQTPHRASGVLGPVTCVETARSVIGLHDKDILTSPELLARLWRDR